MPCDWPALPVYQSAADMPSLPAGWKAYRVENLYESLGAGRRYEQKTVLAEGCIPVLHQKAEGYLGFHNDTPGVVASIQDPVATFANHTCEMRLMVRPFSAIQNVFPTRGKTGLCLTRFLYYGTKGRIRLSEYKGHHPDFRRMWIGLPPLGEQQAIVGVLGALDDKIDNANGIGDLTSDLAIAVGVSALEGAVGKPVYLSAQADLIKGVSYRSEDLAEGGSRLVGLKCVGRDGRFHREGLKPFSGDCRPEQAVGPGDVLVAQTDLTQKAEVIGRPIRLPNLGSRGHLVASLDLVIARPHAPLTREILIALLSTQSFHDHAMSYCNGTTVLHMSSRALPDYQFIMPNSFTIEKISNIMRPLFARADAALSESLVLARLRDVLLPRLLSGELRVRDAGALVAGAV